jgi:hypothetical protein
MSFQAVGIEVMVESNKVDVHGIQHQLDAHQHGDHIPADKYAQQSYKKDQRA